MDIKIEQGNQTDTLIMIQLIIHLILSHVQSQSTTNEGPLILWPIVDDRAYRLVVTNKTQSWWNQIEQGNQTIINEIGETLCKTLSIKINASTPNWCDPEAIQAMGNAVHLRSIDRRDTLKQYWWPNALLFQKLSETEGIPLFLGLKCFVESPMDGNGNGIQYDPIPSNNPEHCIPTALGHVKEDSIWKWLTADGKNSVRYASWKEFWEMVELRNRLVERTLQAYNVSDKEYFDYFASDPIFDYLGASESIPTDYESVALSKTINITLTTLFLSLNEPLLGYADPTQFLKLHPANDTNLRTQNTCRHALMLTMLLTELKKEKEELLSVIEIGGGYGNMCRLAWEIIGFNEWNIVDLTLVSRLQKWWLNSASLSNNGIQYINFIPSNEIHQLSHEMWEDRNSPDLWETPNILIATHSWSEFDLSKWFMYFNTFVRESTIKWVLYAYQTDEGSRKKINVLMQYFDVKNSLVTESGSVKIMILCRKLKK